MTRPRAIRILSTTMFSIGLAGLLQADIQIAVNGSTGYSVVKPADASPVDEYAIDTLTNYLQRITGAAFPVIDPAEVNAEASLIFVGLSDPALPGLGKDPLGNLDDQEHVAKSVNGNIYLYGKGVHANLWAVMDFLEDSIGWRWFSVHEKPALPSRPTITLEDFNRQNCPSIKYRQTGLNFGSHFYYQQGINMGFALKKWPPPFISKIPSTRFVHSILSYIPPTPNSTYADRFEWQEKKDYFETHPEFFTLNEFGKRVSNKQLCFSNPQLRKELTANVIKDIKYSSNLPGEGLIITIDAADTPDKFCYCPACEALEKQYQNTGGPLYDYIIELCRHLEEKYPHVWVRTLAYRRSQTQHPPVLPEGDMFPENFIVAFAPIEDAYHADWWNHRDPDIQETYRDMLQWGRITHHLWAWIYPNPWGTGAFMPLGNIERLVNNMRLMVYAGVEGLFADHNGINSRNSFAELQAYIFFHLMRDIDSDVAALVTDFTDHHYGAAGELMRTYINELEQGRKAMNAPPGVTYNSKNFDDETFPYLTVENIHRWQEYFDRMEALTAATPDALIHVQTVRRKLDFATLWKWVELNSTYPDYFPDHNAIASRIRTTNKEVSRKFQVRPVGAALVDSFVLKIKAGGKEPPLPAQFDGIDPKRVKQLVPIGRRESAAYIEDPSAAFGYASPVDLPDSPFNFGFYPTDRATRDESALPPLPPDSKAGWKRALNRNFTLQRGIGQSEIEPGKYRVYELGEIEVTPSCMIWFSAKSWATHVEIGKQLYEPGADNLWDAYASLKFDGPAYGGEAKDNRVLVDRVILVRKSENQFTVK